MALCSVVADERRAKPPPGFVTTSGTGFVLDGKPFAVLGVNNHYLMFGTKKGVTDVLEDAVAMLCYCWRDCRDDIEPGIK
jgi:hypothetical protein